MIPPKFKIGDVVINFLDYKCRIVEMKYSKGSWRYRVEFINIPGAYKIDDFIIEENLKFHYDMPKNLEQYTPKGPTCPKCNSKWFVSGFGLKKYHDCLICKKTAEELEKSPAYIWHY